MNIAEKYIQDAAEGKIVVGTDIANQCRRHLQNLSISKSSSFPFYFDGEQATRVLKFAGLSFFGKGKLRGQPFKLEGWQAALLWQAYGWHRKDSGTKKYSEVFCKVPRKNGKTELLGLVGNYGFCREGFKSVEKDVDIYWGATKKDQAKIGWGIQKSQLKLLRQAYPKIRNYSRILTHDILTTQGAGGVYYLGKDSDRDDGFNPFYALIDEYHAHKTNDIIKVMESGMGARVSPMTWIITTAGNLLFGPCHEYEMRAKQVASGAIENENILPWIFDLDEGDDWENPDNWAKVNPNLGVSLSLEFLKKQYKKAITMGADFESNFKTKNLNIYVSSTSTFIRDAIYREQQEKIDLDALRGKIAYGGLDLASDADTTCYCLYFPEQEGLKKAVVLFHYFIPEDNVAERVKTDNVPYLQWIKDGWITTTPGNVTDYDYIKRHIVKQHELYTIKSNAYDRWNSSQLVIDLTNEGLEFEGYAQTATRMNAPVREYRRLITNGLINMGLNPVARWQNSNAAIYSDGNDNIKFDKKRSSERIDGMVAMAMAIGQRMEKHGTAQSIYDTREDGLIIL